MVHSINCVDTDKEPSADPRKYLILINPAGGKGKAVHIFRTQVQPLLNLAGAECQVVVTGACVCVYVHIVYVLYYLVD